MGGKDILNIPMNPDENDAEASTIGEYLQKLLILLWEEGESFNGKRPFGNSGWDYELYIALAKSDLIEADFDEDGYIEDVDDDAGNKLIFSAIKAMYTKPL